MNEIERSCRDSLIGRELDIGDQFYMKKFSVKSKDGWATGIERTIDSPPPIATLPGSPERERLTTPQHPCGEEYVAVMELIQDAWQTGIDKTAECEHLKKKLQLMKEQHTESMVLTDMKRSFDLVWTECFGVDGFPFVKAHFKSRLGL